MQGVKQHGGHAQAAPLDGSSGNWRRRRTLAAAAGTPTAAAAFLHSSPGLVLPAWQPLRARAAQQGHVPCQGVERCTLVEPDRRRTHEHLQLGAMRRLPPRRMCAGMDLRGEGRAASTGSRGSGVSLRAQWHGAASHSASLGASAQAKRRTCLGFMPAQAGDCLPLAATRRARGTWRPPHCPHPPHPRVQGQCSGHAA